jgi:hypothetical protein
MPSEIARTTTTVAVTRGELVMKSRTSGSNRDDIGSRVRGCHLEEDGTPGDPHKGET